jgi:AcrR family transcriptional regulator
LYEPEAGRVRAVLVTTGGPSPATAERILDATLVELARRGARGLSMSNVSATAGLSRPTLYRYYPTKDDLLRALGRHEQRRFNEGLMAALAAERTPTGRLDAALRYLVAFLDAYPARQVVEIEPAFILERLAESLPVQAEALSGLLGDALERTPAVRRGEAAPRDVAEVLVRLAMSHYLLPHTSPDALLRTLRGLVGIPQRGRDDRR